MSYESRLREARKRAGLTQEALGKMVGCAKTTITGYETGKSEPNMYILSKIMEALNVDANFIFQDEMLEHYKNSATPDEMENIIRKYRCLDPIAQQAIRMLLDIELQRSTATCRLDDSNLVEPTCNIPFKVSDQPASAGTGVYLGPDGFTEHMVNAEAVNGADFGVPVSGDSMEPLYKDGDIILVSMSSPVQMGDIALVTMDGCGYVKKLGKGVLISVNHHYDPIPVTEDIRINGKVIGVLPAQTE